MKLKHIKRIIDFKNISRPKKSITYGCYPHIVKDKIYWQSRCDNQKTSVEYGIDPFENIKIPEKNITLKNSLASQNFRVFYDTNPNTRDDEKWKAIGGYHVGRAAVKNISKNHDILSSPLHTELKDCNFSKTLKVKKITDVVWENETRLLFEDFYFHPRHANGFYIFTSKDGIEWKTYSEKPILSAFTDCEGEKISVGSDNMPSIFYDQKLKEYTAYIRCNIKLGVRNVLVTSSKDLKNWSKPKLIQKDPKFDFSCENLYYFDAYQSQNLGVYIAFAPHFKNKILDSLGAQRKYYDAKTLVMMSQDKINWFVVDEIFKDSSSGHLTQKHVVTFVEDKSKFYLCVHENFMTFNNFVNLYEIDSEDMLRISKKFKKENS